MPMSGTPGENQVLLSTVPPSREQTWLAGWVLLGLVAALLITMPFADVPLGNTEILLPAYAVAVLMNELITSALLFALYSIQRSRAVLVLSIGYLFSGLMMGPWALTFPGVFAPSGLLGADLQSTASIAAMRRLGFPLFVLAYAVLKSSGLTIQDSRRSVKAIILRSVVAVVVIVCGLTWLSVADDRVLPRFMTDSGQVSALWQYVPGSASAISVIALSFLWMRRHSVLDLWLMVALCAWLIETFLLGFLSSGRFSIGWWAGRVYGFTSASVVLLALLWETITLYARLARSVSAERRIREARLTTLEVLSASIAHEVNQPLASMVTNADAGLRWLDRKPPDLDEARVALKSISSDGHRAGKLIESVRVMFRKGPQERVCLNMNDLIQEVLRHARHETRLNRVLVETKLDENLPLVTGNPVQLQQVVLNLVTNAVDAMSSVVDRPRVLRIETAPHQSDAILLSVEDAGVGPDPKIKERIFEPFFTTKSHGIGMGLMICQSIIEAHGGRIWMTDNSPHGATFQFTLPADEDHKPPGAERVQ